MKLDGGHLTFGSIEGCHVKDNMCQADASDGGLVEGVKLEVCHVKNKMCQADAGEAY